MGLLGIFLGLLVLIGLSFRGWSVLVLAPLAALVAALASSEPLLAHWTQTFMGAAAGFVAQFFPLFLLGAIFGKLMEDSGSVSTIARFMTDKLGAKRAILAVVLAGAIVTYGGVSLMAVMSPDRHAGVYLGLWTISNLLFKGLGTFLGGATRDLFLLQMNLAPGLSYGVVFLLQALGLATAALLLARIDILGFARDTGRHVNLIEAQIATAD